MVTGFKSEMFSANIIQFMNVTFIYDSIAKSMD